MPRETLLPRTLADPGDRNRSKPFSWWRSPPRRRFVPAVQTRSLTVGLPLAGHLFHANGLPHLTVFRSVTGADPMLCRARQSTTAPHHTTTRRPSGESHISDIVDSREPDSRGETHRVSPLASQGSAIGSRPERSRVRVGRRADRFLLSSDLCELMLRVLPEPPDDARKLKAARLHERSDTAS